MNGRLAIYLRRRVAVQILALLAVLTAMMQMLELLDVTTEILERGQGFTTRCCGCRPSWGWRCRWRCCSVR